MCSPGCRFCTTPKATRRIANSTDSGSTIRSHPRSRSTQKFPGLRPDVAAVPAAGRHRRPSRQRHWRRRPRPGRSRVPDARGWTPRRSSPTRVRDEADRDAERQHRRHPRTAIGQREVRLQPRQPLQHQDADCGECQQGTEIMRPILFPVRVHAAPSIDHGFDLPMPTRV